MRLMRDSADSCNYLSVFSQIVSNLFKFTKRAEHRAAVGNLLEAFILQVPNDWIRLVRAGTDVSLLAH